MSLGTDEKKKKKVKKFESAVKREQISSCRLRLLVLLHSRMHGVCAKFSGKDVSSFVDRFPIVADL